MQLGTPQSCCFADYKTLVRTERDQNFSMKGERVETERETKRETDREIGRDR